MSFYFDEDHTDDERDLPKTRTFPYGSSNTILAKQTQPYGFWVLSLKHGEIPDDFKGTYTGLDMVEKAVVALQARKAPKRPPRPKIKYKKVKETVDHAKSTNSID